MSNEKAGIDVADMLDSDIVRIGKLWDSLMYRYSQKTATKQNLTSLASQAKSEFFDIGYVVNVNVIPKMLDVGPVELEIIGYVPGHEFHEHGLDHSRKRVEVLESRDRGEKFLGEKDGRTI